MFGTTIESPFGITVFGSAIIRVEPDIASVRFSVDRLEEHPKDAFREVHTAVRSVRDFLTSNSFDDFGSSRITLNATHRYVKGQNEFVGYTASIEFHLILHDLDRLESLLIGIVDAGANEINSVSYETSMLKELRADTRKRAVLAAKEKAQIYCESAGVGLGSVLHIADVNPEVLHGRDSHGMRLPDISPDSEDIDDSFNPGAIAVGGAVSMAFAIE